MGENRKRPIKILVATGLYPPDIGGPATHVVFLEENLPTDKFDLTIVPFREVRKYPKVIRHVVYAWRLWRHAKTADLIYALDPISVGLPALLVSKLRKKPFLVRLGGDYAWEQGRARFGLQVTLDEYIRDMKSAPRFVRVLAKIQTQVVARANKVVVPSQYLKGVVEAWGIDSKSIQVIYSALHPLPASKSRAELRRELNYSDPTIVSVGRLVPWKGFSVLIDVIDTLRRHYPRILLVIVGEGVEQAKLEAQVQAKNLSQNVRFAGGVDKKDLSALIKAADVFVLNTAYEGLSHQLIEVMDVGVPIVTTTIGGNRELITSGVEGLLVTDNNMTELAEAISKQIDNPELAKRMVQSAQIRAQAFQKDQVVDQVVTLFEEACTEG